MKSRRHLVIMNLISNERIETQEELCESLKNKGFDITQATVSRDIKELQLLKVPDEKGYRYALPGKTGNKNSSERMKRLFSDSVISIDYSESIIVIKTLPGTAQSVASLIDASENQEILGTVAGDDTIFVAVRKNKLILDIVRWFKQISEQSHRH